MSTSKSNIRYLKVSLVVAGLMGVAFGYQNCGKAAFSNIASTGSANALNSTNVQCPLQTLTIPIKVLFVVDLSLSNTHSSTRDATECNDTSVPGCYPATDPNKVFRSGTITNFFNAYKNKSNFSWGFEVFNGGTASYIFSNSGPILATSSQMQSAITTFNNAAHDGGTAYLKALKGAKSIIEADADLHSTAAHPPLYNIVFMSDGYPSDTNNLNDIGAAMNDILNLAPTRITFSSIYYSTTYDTYAASILQGMATMGHGQFEAVYTSPPSAIPIDDLITVPNGQCQ